MKRCEASAVASDKSNDINEVVQLSVFTRYFLDGSYHKDLMGVISMGDCTTGAFIHDNFQNYMQEKNIPVNKIIGIATDGAPAMVGKNNGFLKHLHDVNSDFIAYPMSQYYVQNCEILLN